jgi:hypothetical protein
MNILITSGGTKVPIDRVRHIANMSSGTFGSKIAYESLKADHNVHFFYAKDSKTPFTVRKNLLKINTLNDSLREIQNLYNDFIKYYQNYQEITYEDFNSYFAKLEQLVKDTSPDVIVLKLLLRVVFKVKE